MAPLNLLLGTLCVAVSASHISAPPPAVAELALLTEAAAAQGAVFLDGSPAARYISRGDPFKWIVYQEGVSWGGRRGLFGVAAVSLSLLTAFDES